MSDIIEQLDHWFDTPDEQAAVLRCWRAFKDRMHVVDPTGQAGVSFVELEAEIIVERDGWFEGFDPEDEFLRNEVVAFLLDNYL